MTQETVTVELKHTWFAPTTSWKKSRLQEMSGRRFKKGIYTWPVSVIPHLPKSAVILKGLPEEQQDPFDGQGFGGFVDDDERYQVDHERAAASEEQRIEAEADKANRLTKKTPDEILAERRANLAKAREASLAAKAAKAEGKPREEASAKADPDAPEAPAVTEGPSEIVVTDDADTIEF